MKCTYRQSMSTCNNDMCIEFSEHGGYVTSQSLTILMIWDKTDDKENKRQF